MTNVGIAFTRARVGLWDIFRFFSSCSSEQRHAETLRMKFAVPSSKSTRRVQKSAASQILQLSTRQHHNIITIHYIDMA